MIEKIRKLLLERADKNVDKRFIKKYSTKIEYKEWKRSMK